MAELARALVKPAEAATLEPVKPPRNGGILGADRILHSLVLFNLLFAVQTILDVIYLWGHTALPRDVSYASDAHRGAYHLVVTALLAAGFVLAAMRPGGPAERSWLIRSLVYLWVVQNTLLALSSMLRLDLQVQIYLLTWWRFAVRLRSHPCFPPWLPCRTAGKQMASRCSGGFRSWRLQRALDARPEGMSAG